MVILHRQLISSSQLYYTFIKHRSLIWIFACIAISLLLGQWLSFANHTESLLVMELLKDVDTDPTNITQTENIDITSYDP